MGAGASSNQLNQLSSAGYTQDEIAALSSQSQGVSELELKALQSFFQAMNGEKWNDKSGWCSTANVSQWKGIRVENGHVTELNLYGNELIGEIPEAFFNLPCLRLLELGANQVNGSISNKVLKLVSLRVWATNSNEISGVLPEEIGMLCNLDELLVKDNKLTGHIPGSVLRKKGLSFESKGNDHLRCGSEVGLDTPQWEWYVMCREEILKLARIPPHEEALQRGLLHRMNCLFKAYEQWSFERVDAQQVTTHMQVNRNEIVLFSHRWDTPSLDPNQAHPDRPDNSKLRHIKEYLIAHPEIKLAFLDYWSLQQAASAWAPPMVAIKGIKSLPYYVHCSGHFVTLCRSEENLQDYLQRAWCQLEVLCCNCPIEEFTTRQYDGVRWTGNVPTGVYNPLPTKRVASTWNGEGDSSDRVEQDLNNIISNGIPNPVKGNLTCDRDRPAIAGVCVRVLQEMIFVHEKQVSAGKTTSLQHLMDFAKALLAENQAFLSESEKLNN